MCWGITMTIKLLIQATIKFLLGVLLVGALIFLPAGTFSFLCGWLFMGLLFVPMLFVGIVMMFKNPELLKKRLQAKEKQKDQDAVVKWSGLMFLAGFIVAGLDFRFAWLILPKGVVIGASVVFLLSYLLLLSAPPLSRRTNCAVFTPTYLRRTCAAFTPGYFGQADGQISFKKHSPHFGERAVQTVRPSWIM